jgi:hypothetical protein
MTQFTQDTLDDHDPAVRVAELFTRKYERQEDMWLPIPFSPTRRRRRRLSMPVTGPRKVTTGKVRRCPQPNCRRRISFIFAALPMTESLGSTS